MSARFLVGDVFDRMAELEDPYDLIITSPPFLALRSYLPDGHPDKAKEIGSEATPAAFLDVMLALTAEWGRLLAPHGSIAIEIGDTYSGSGGAGGDYNDGGLRAGQAAFDGSAARSRKTSTTGNHQQRQTPSGSSEQALSRGKGTNQHQSPGHLSRTPEGESDAGPTLDSKSEGTPPVDDIEAGSGITGDATRRRRLHPDVDGRHRNSDPDRRELRYNRNDNGGEGWPPAKSLAMIPELYAASLAYGRNLLTGQPSPAGRWRVRNFKPWIRSNPPVGALGDKERPATSYVTVACRATDRYFDLDAVRTPYAPTWVSGNEQLERGGQYQGPKVEGATAPVQSKMPIRKLTHEGAPPLDWWHQVDALIDHIIDERAGKTANRRTAKGVDQQPRTGKSANRDGNWSDLPELAETNGAVGARGVHIRRALETAGHLTTLDAIDVSPKGYAGMTRPTTRLVPCGPHDGGLRTTSRGCPLHGDRPAPAPTAPDDAHAGNQATRTRRNGDRPAQEQPAGSVPTDPHSERSTEEPSSDSPDQSRGSAATSHNKAASRTGLAPETTSPDTASGRSSDCTDGTSEAPLFDVPHPDTPSSRTDEAGPPSPESDTDDGTARTSDPLAACTCSYHLAVKDSDSTSHYAVWPPLLVKLLLQEMAPRRVCTTCGQPSRRIVNKANADDERRALAEHMRERRVAAGLTVKDVATHFPSKTGGLTGCVANWEAGSNVPTAEQWPVLKALLSLDSEFDHVVLGDRRWTESTAEYHGQNGQQVAKSDRVTGDFQGSGSAGKRDGGITATRQTLGWSDCGHGTWRPPRILDPFAGSGTTLAVATGHGIDADGIDIDERNADLAQERCGMFLEVIDHPKETVA